VDKLGQALEFYKSKADDNG